MKKSIFILSLSFSSYVCAFSQNSKHDQRFCKVYELSMNYINQKYTNAKQQYVFDDSLVNPYNPGTGRYIKRTQTHQLSFYILKKKSRFNSNDVKYWFADLLKDSILKRYRYSLDTESVMACTFPQNIKFQFRNYEEVRCFTTHDFQTEIKGTDTIHYTPVRITFSNVLYSGNIALIYAKLFIGLGGGSDAAAYGFEFKKKGSQWILDKVNIETL